MSTPSTEIQHASPKYLVGGIFNSAELLEPAIKSLSEKHNLIVPGAAIGGGQLPPLYAAGLSFVFIDPKTETYPIPNKSALGIGKNALDRIAAGAGVRWDPRLCGRLDNGSDPHIVEYQAAGTVLQLDGTERMITGSKRIDLRADESAPISSWGADAQEIARVSKLKSREPWPQILQQRQHILSLAESKAKNRAIRSLGVRTAYEPADLAKGFVILRLQFTGRSDDPEVQREIEMMITRRALGASSMLYGGSNMDTRALPPTRPSGAVLRVTQVETEEERAEPEPSDADEDAGSDSVPETPEQKTTSAPAKPAADPLLICGRKGADGKYPRKPASQFTIDALREKISYAEGTRGEWNPQYAEKNEAELKAMKAWLAFKEFDPRQGSLPMDGAAKTEKDPF